MEGQRGVQPPCASPALGSAQDHPPSWHVDPLAPHWPGSTAGPGWHPLTVNAHCPFTLVLWAGFKLLNDVTTALKGHARHLGQSRGLETKLASGSPSSSSTTANPPTPPLATASPRGQHGGAETLVLVVCSPHWGAHWPPLVSQDLGLDGQQKIEGPLALEELALAKDPCQGEGLWPHQLGHPPLTPCWGSQASRSEAWYEKVQEGQDCVPSWRSGGVSPGPSCHLPKSLSRKLHTTAKPRWPHVRG